MWTAICSMLSGADLTLQFGANTYIMHALSGTSGESSERWQKVRNSSQACADEFDRAAGRKIKLTAIRTLWLNRASRSRLQPTQRNVIDLMCVLIKLPRHLGAYVYARLRIHSSVEFVRVAPCGKSPVQQVCPACTAFDRVSRRNAFK